MRVLIPMVSGGAGPDGVGRHAINVVRCLLSLDETQTVDLVIGNWQRRYVESALGTLDPRLNLLVAETQRSSPARNLWYYNRLPGLAKERRSSLIHLTYPVPVNRNRLSCPVVVTLHDLYPYDVAENFGYPKVLINRLILQQCLSAADAIACVSDSTLERLAIRWPALNAKALRIYNCVEPHIQSEADPSEVNPRRPFLLSVSQHRHNKNIPLTFAVLRRLLHTAPSLMLVLVGRQGPETSILKASLESSGLGSRVMMLESISEDNLQWYYRHALCLLATSTHEGFGLPVAEAMLAGCPVVCSDIAAFREIGEGYCSFVPPGVDQEDGFAHAVHHAMRQPRPAAATMPQLSSSNIAARYGQLYRGLLDSTAQNAEVALRFSRETGGAA